jgi:DNA invertase Pin-like site-specific DNA recombinase
MSTEHQRYSIANQHAVIAQYALTHGMEVVETYADPGKSGLTLRRRPGLQRLLNDVISGQDRYSAVLVYDVSRWGRFQDADESAHYEFLLRREGVRVVYCAEPFENDGSSYASIVKALKRTMAGEYSREMSTRIIHARRRYAEQGFWQGSKIGLGLARALVDPDGRHKSILQEHQRKSLQSDHIVLVPGPKAEQAIVRRVFELFAYESWSLVAIARWLQAHGVRRPYGGAWKEDGVRRLLENEAYIGNLVTGKFAGSLGGDWRRQKPECWRRVEGVYEPIVDRALFERTARILKLKGKRLSDETLLDALRDLLKRKGRLSLELVCADPFTPGGSAYFRRFGGLTKAYELIGYDPKRNMRHLDDLSVIQQIRTAFIAQILDGFEASGATVARVGKRRIRINDFTAAVSVLRRCDKARPWGFYWFFSTKARREVDLFVVLRLAPGELEPMDMLFVPSAATAGARIYLRDPLQSSFAPFRYESLERLFAVEERAQLCRLKRPAPGRSPGERNGQLTTSVAAPKRGRRSPESKPPAR